MITFYNVSRWKTLSMPLPRKTFVHQHHPKLTLSIYVITLLFTPWLNLQSRRMTCWHAEHSNGLCYVANFPAISHSLLMGKYTDCWCHSTQVTIQSAGVNSQVSVYYGIWLSMWYVYISYIYNARDPLSHQPIYLNPLRFWSRRARVF